MDLDEDSTNKEVIPLNQSQTKCSVSQERRSGRSPVVVSRECYCAAPSELVKEHVALLEMRWRLAPTESCPNPGTITQMHSLGFDQLLDGTLPLDELAPFAI